MRFLQALQVVVQVAHRKVSDSAPVEEGDVREREAVRMAAISARSVTSMLPANGRATSSLWLASYNGCPQTASTTACLSIR